MKWRDIILVDRIEDGKAHLYIEIGNIHCEFSIDAENLPNYAELQHVEVLIPHKEISSLRSVLESISSKHYTRIEDTGIEVVGPAIDERIANMDWEETLDEMDRLFGRHHEP